MWAKRIYHRYHELMGETRKLRRNIDSTTNDNADNADNADMWIPQSVGIRGELEHNDGQMDMSSGAQIELRCWQPTVSHSEGTEGAVACDVQIEADDKLHAPQVCMDVAAGVIAVDDTNQNLETMVTNPLCKLQM